MIDIFGTLGPSCANENTLYQMFACGMTGIRINLSHMNLKDCKEWLDMVKKTSKLANVEPNILIDMRGPELRIGDFTIPFELQVDATVLLGEEIPVPSTIFSYLEKGDHVLLDDGKFLLEVEEVLEGNAKCKVIRGGILTSKKSLSIESKSIDMPTLTESDIENLKVAKDYGVTGIMQPFVRDANDLITIQKTLEELDATELKVYAKIENISGVKHLDELLPYCDEIVIARGDLGNSMPIYELPGVSCFIQESCKKHQKPYMVVTQMLDSMMRNPVPTRAEVSDIFYAIYHGASSIMLTGETAVGLYPIKTMDMFVKTANSALAYKEKGN